MSTRETIIHLKHKAIVDVIKPLKKFDYADCLKLKDRGYVFFGTDFTERPNENCLVLYPFRNEEAAKKFSKTDDETEPFILVINDDLKNITHKISDIKVYVQFL